MLTKTDLFELLSVKNKDFQIHDHDPLFTVKDSERVFAVSKANAEAAIAGAYKVDIAE